MPENVMGEPISVVMISAMSPISAMTCAATAERMAALSVGGTLFSAGFVYWTTMRRKPSEGPLFASVVDSTLVKPGELAAAERIADQLARRDFIYLVVALAVLGKVRWFLWMGAVGAPIYFLALSS